MAVTGTWYTTLAEARAYHPSLTGEAAEQQFEHAIETASRWIDDYCNRRFYTTDEDETRYYTPEDADWLRIDDLISLTSLTVDEDGDRTYETTWAATDYDLLPYNSTPKTRLAVTPNGAYAFPVGLARSVKLVGTFGYASSAPVPVQRACLLLTARLLDRRHREQAVIGGSNLGQIVPIPVMDPDVARLLGAYRRVGGRAV